MAADLSKVRSQYIAGLQTAATKIIELNRLLDDLGRLYSGAGLSGTFVDAEIEADITTKHLSAALVGTYTANLDTVNTALSDAILQNMAKAIGKPV